MHINAEPSRVFLGGAGIWLKAAENIQRFIFVCSIYAVYYYIPDLWKYLFLVLYFIAKAIKQLFHDTVHIIATVVQTFGQDCR